MPAAKENALMHRPEKRAWSVLLEITPGAVRLLVTEPRGDVIKAQFTAYPDHCRALMFILEGLALWCGSPLSVVVCADVPVDHSFGLGPFGDAWPEETALVQFQFATAISDEHEAAGARINGIGDFTKLRRIQRWGGRR